MKYVLFFVLAIFIAVHPTFSQEYSRKFGKLSQGEVDIKVYEKDPEAAAVVLYDIGESEFIDTEHGYEIQFTRTKRIKILSRPGIEHAEITLPYYVDGYGKTERYRTIEAFSYTMEDGRLVKVPLDESTIYEEIISDRWKAKKFVLPNVKEGTIIEYRSVLQTPFHFNLPDWVFQDVIPTIYSKYTVKMIPFYEYVFIVKGISKFSYQNSEAEKGLTRKFRSLEFHNLVHTYVLENVTAFKDEAYMTSPKDYLIRMDFQLAKFHSPDGSTNEIMSTWEDLNKSLIKQSSFGKYIKKSAKIAEKILEEELTLGDLDTEIKVKEIVNYVKSTFSWNGYNSKYASKTPKEFTSQKTGNSADINLFLIALLETAGIEVEAVIISTRNHGKISIDYPFSHFFNYVIPIIKIDDHTFLSDGTDSYIAYNRIPSRCINEKGLVVDHSLVDWIDLSTNIKSINHRSIELKIDPETLTAETRVINQTTEFESSQYKSTYNNDTSKIKNHLLENGFESLSKIKTLKFENPTVPYTVAYEGETKIESIDDKIIISPFLKYPIQENKLTQKTRSFPVDIIYPKSETFKSIIILPQHYKVAELPKPFKMDNTMAKINLMYRVKDGVVTVDGEYYFKKAVYQANEYARIKSYLNAIVKKFNTQLVLVKSGEI